MPRKVTLNDLRRIVREETADARKHARTQATDNMGKLGYGQPAVKSSGPLTTGFGTLVRAYARAGGSRSHTRDLLKSWNAPAHVLKVLDTTLTGGGILIGQDLAEEIIELLRPLSAVRSAEPRRVTARLGAKDFPRLDVGASASYVEEGADLPMSSPEFGAVQMFARKLGTIVAINNELLEFDSLDSDRIVEDDMIAAAAQTEDGAFLRGDGTQASPKGLTNWAAAANVFASAGNTLDNKRTDLLTAIDKLESSNVRALRPAWFMSSRSKNGLIKEVDGNGNFVFRDELMRGRLFDIPVFITNNIPNNLDASGLANNDESEVILADMNNVVVGDVQGVRVETSREASFDDSGTLRSAFMSDKTLVRVILHNDLIARHPEAIAVVEQVTWSP